MNCYLTTKFSATWLAILLATFAMFGAAHASSMEQARAKCHEQFLPIVKACVHRKMAETGGSGGKYIAGCRAAIMPQARACIAKLLGTSKEGSAEDVIDGSASTDSSPAEIYIPAPSGKGHVVIVISGTEGTTAYVDYAAKIAKLGYYTVILDGKDILAGEPGSDRLHRAIVKAQSSPDALPGKVAVIGFSMGGGGALTYAERRPDLVSNIVAYYPATNFIAKLADMKSYVGKFQVPALVLAGGKDSFRDCCLLATIKDMEATAKELGKPMELVVYPEAGHNFIKGLDYRAADAEDAFRRTTDALHQYLNEPDSR